MNDIFNERIAVVRRRFVTKLDARIDEIELSIPQPGREGGLDALELAHRQAHSLCGVGPTLGFIGTGTVGRSIEQLLLVAVKAKRALAEDEIPRLRAGIALLRSTATAEIHPASQK